jgi:hypothetical protein
VNTETTGCVAVELDALTIAILRASSSDGSTPDRVIVQWRSRDDSDDWPVTRITVRQNRVKKLCHLKNWAYSKGHFTDIRGVNRDNPDLS